MHSLACTCACLLHMQPVGVSGVRDIFCQNARVDLHRTHTQQTCPVHSLLCPTVCVPGIRKVTTAPTVRVLNVRTPKPISARNTRHRIMCERLCELRNKGATRSAIGIDSFKHTAINCTGRTRHLEFLYAVSRTVHRHY